MHPEPNVCSRPEADVVKPGQMRHASSKDPQGDGPSHGETQPDKKQRATVRQANVHFASAPEPGCSALVGGDMRPLAQPDGCRPRRETDVPANSGYA